MGFCKWTQGVKFFVSYIHTLQEASTGKDQAEQQPGQASCLQFLLTLGFHNMLINSDRGGRLVVHEASIVGVCLPRLRVTLTAPWVIRSADQEQFLYCQESGALIIRKCALRTCDGSMETCAWNSRGPLQRSWYSHAQCYL